MKDKVPLISIVIPVKNGLKTLKNCIEAIFDQTMIDQTEIIIIDSGSTDGSLELIKQYPEIRLIEIPREEFSHGGTRNLGIKKAKAEFVVLTVQDAIPRNEKWLEIMIQHFQDPEVVGVCGMQYVPHHPHYNPYEWHRPFSKPQAHFYQFENASEFEMLTPGEKREVCRWDDVNSMYRKSIFNTFPFSDVTFGEDMLWAMRALKAGLKLVYEPEAKVEHYHHSTFKYTYKRCLTDWYFTYKYFGYNPSDKITMYQFLKMIYQAVKYSINPKWLIFNIKKNCAINKAWKDFNLYIKDGEDALDKFYSKSCIGIPQGIHAK